MKKQVSLVLLACVLLSFSACGATQRGASTVPVPGLQQQSFESIAAGYAQWLKTPYECSFDEDIPVVYYGEPFSLSQGGHRLGISMSMTTDYFQTLSRAFTEKAEAQGNTVTVISAERSPAKQISDIEDLISAGCDVIAVSAIDRVAITPALIAIQNAGVYCISFDAAPADLSYTQGFVGTDNYAAGYEGGVQMRKDYPQGGKVAVLSGRASTAGMLREEGFLAAIEGSNLKVVITLDSEGDQQRGLDDTTDILQAFGDGLVAIWGVNDQCIMGAYAACKTSGVDIGLYGVDGTPESRGYIQENGIFKMTAAQSPITIGVLLYAYMEALVSQQKMTYNKIEIEVIVMTPQTVPAYVDAEWQ